MASLVQTLLIKPKHHYGCISIYEPLIVIVNGVFGILTFFKSTWLTFWSFCALLWAFEIRSTNRWQLFSFFKDFRADLREGYPLNLSILLSGGQETNKDSLSTGEGSGMSSSLKSPTSVGELWPMEISPWWGQVQVVVGTACLRGLKPRSWSDHSPHRKVFRESCCSGLQH